MATDADFMVRAKEADIEDLVETLFEPQHYHLIHEYKILIQSGHALESGRGRPKRSRDYVEWNKDGKWHSWNQLNCPGHANY